MPAGVVVGDHGDDARAEDREENEAAVLEAAEEVDAFVDPVHKTRSVKRGFRSDLKPSGRRGSRMAGALGVENRRDEPQRLGEHFSVSVSGAV